MNFVEDFFPPADFVLILLQFAGFLVGLAFCVIVALATLIVTTTALVRVAGKYFGSRVARTVQIFIATIVGLAPAVIVYAVMSERGMETDFVLPMTLMVLGAGISLGSVIGAVSSDAIAKKTPAPAADTNTTA